MILTEQNRNPKNLGETQTFSVSESQLTGHSADTMKKRINSSNEQALAQKNHAVRTNQASAQSGQQRPQPMNRAAHPAANNVQMQNMQNRPQRAVGTSPQSGQAVSQTVRPAAQNRPVQRAAQNVQKPMQKPAQKPTVQNSAPRLAANPAAKDIQPRAQMLQTKVTDVTYMQAENDKIKSNSADKKSKKKDNYSDEGGNTVVSVVKAVIYIIFVVVIAVFLALTIINVGNDMFSFVKSDEMVEVTIPEYATLDEVADILYRNDIIKYPTIFKIYAVNEGADTNFLAGTYMVNGMMNYETLLGEFKEKPETGTVDITIPEGYTVDEIIDLFVEGYGMGTREGFVDVIQNGEFDYWFINELEENGMKDGRIYRLEGYLFPDTYQFYKASSEYTIVNKMLKRFSQIFTKEYRAQCEVLGYTVDEMITLASIIEKEAGSPSDFFIVSSVFHNRLNSPWNFPKLESDATMVYVLSHENGERTNVTAADLETDSVYNTYLYDGFPPGPIANPSASAMLAALSPQDTNYYYFITNKGLLYPSETKEQHDAYIAQFRDDTTVQQTTGDVQQ